ncbi:MAG: O-antigen ligase family protein [Gaiellales bacterium]
MTTAGSIIGAAGLLPLFVSGDLRLRRIGFVAWLVGSLLVAASLLSNVETHVRHTASGHPALAVAGGVLGIVGLVVGGYLAYRYPWLFLCVVVAAAPFRVPLTVGGTHANLLVPLYGVIAAGALATAYELVRGRETPPRLGWIGLALGAFVLWSGISMAWSSDRHQGAVTMLFFYLPFGILVARLGQLRERPDGLRWALTVQVCLAVLFGAVALWQEATHHIFWNPVVEVGNTYKSYFRVNSLFWDASIYARFMAITIVLLAGVGLHRRMTPWLGALMAFLFVGMYFSYSQSGMLSLAVGALALGAALWPRRVTIALAAAAGVAGLLALAAALHSNSANRVTSDRLHLIRLGERVVEHHPLAGAGLGAFSKAALAGTAHPFRLTGAASHTTPMTVVAEQGPIGIVLYALLIVAVFACAVQPTGNRGARLTLAAVFVALITSSLFYNAFFEDPSTWICMALIAFVTSRLSPSVPERPA